MVGASTHRGGGGTELGNVWLAIHMGSPASSCAALKLAGKRQARNWEEARGTGNAMGTQQIDLGSHPVPPLGAL